MAKMKLIHRKQLQYSNILFLLLLFTIVVIFVYELNRTTTFSNFKLNKSFKNKVLLQKNLSSILPSQQKSVALNELETMQLADRASNVAAEFWYNWKNNNRTSSSTTTNKDRKDSSINVNDYCAAVRLSSPFQVKHHNLHWQKFERPPDKGERSASNESIVMYLYSAYYDDRIGARPVVRLLSVNNRQTVIGKVEWSCLLWFSHLHYPVLSTAVDLYIIWPEYWQIEDEIYGTQIISCAIPHAHSGKIPRAVSLQDQNSCDKVEQQPSNVLRVIHNRNHNHNTPNPKPKDPKPMYPKPKDPKPKYPKPKNTPNPTYPSIGVCVKSLRYGTLDYSVRLVEWLEMIRILGGEKVYFYVLGAVDNVLKVLDHYKELDGFVEWRYTSLVGTQPNLAALAEHYASTVLGIDFWQEELLELNDCLYRNLFVHDYIAVLDVDELIVPQRVETWQELIVQLNTSKNIAYISSQETRIFASLEEKVLYSMNGPSIPSHLYTMRHTYRSPILLTKSDKSVKSFHRTSLVTAVHNHYPMHCLNTSGHHTCEGVTASTSDSLLMHYRLYELPNCTTTSPKELVTENCTIHDRNMWRYFERLNTQVNDRLRRIFSRN